MDSKVMNNDKTACMYDGKQMSVTEYLRKPEVKKFESKLRKLAYESALCNADGTNVDNGETYPPLREGFPTQQGRRCMYFEKYVLPMDKDVEADYWNVFQGGKVSHSVKGDGTCENCGKTYEKTSNRQKYCESCRQVMENKRTKERMQEKRRK